MAIDEKELKIENTLEVLRKKAEIFEKDINYPIKLWMSTAKKLQDQVLLAFKFETEGNLEMAYMKYLRGSSIVVEIIPNHKDYIMFKSQGGPVLKQYYELRQETSLSLFKCQRIHQILKMRDIEKMHISNKANDIVYTKNVSPESCNEIKDIELTEKDFESNLTHDFSLLNEEMGFMKNDFPEISNIKHTQRINTPNKELESPNYTFPSSNFRFNFMDLGSFVNSDTSKDTNQIAFKKMSEDLNEKLVLSDKTSILSKFFLIEPETLYKYITRKDNKLHILFLDIRPRSEFKRLRIASENIVCIEPIILTLQENMSGDQLEDSLIISPLSEQRMFSDRHKFDLIVYYDWDSKDDNLNGNIFQKEKARILHNLNKAIFGFGGFKKPLKHAPVLLFGGFKAWVDFIKKNNFLHGFLEGTDVDNIRVSLNEDSLPSEHQLNRLSSKSNDNISNSCTSFTEYSLYSIQLESENKYINNSQKETISMNEFELLFKNNIDQVNKNNDSSIVLNNDPHQELQTKHFSQYNLSQQLKYIHDSEMRNIHDTLKKYNNLITLNPSTQKLIQNSSNGFLKRDISLNNPFYEIEKVKNDNYMFHQYSSLSTKEPLDTNGVKKSVLSNINTFDLKTRNTISQNYNIEQYRVHGTIGTTGLTNLGNTCYMNAIIQCLSNTIPFAKYYRDGSYKKHINVNNPLGYKGELTQTFARLISYLWDNEHTYVSPLFFKNVVGRLKEQFRNNDQQDSQEFLVFLLDGLHEELNTAAGRLKPRELTPEEESRIENMPDQIASDIEWQRYIRLNNSIVVSLFQGQLQSRLKCLTCGFQSTTYNPFTYLSLPIPFTQAKTSTLYECLQFFVQKEYLKDKEQWQFSFLDKKDATKTLTISKIPQILLIHLKRFRICGHWKDKINTKVDFLINNFDLTDFLLESIQPFSNSHNHGQYLYHLYAVTNHYGNLDGGHYTAMVKNDFTNSWKLFDDRRVVFCNESDVVSSAAYILFYIRNNAI
ncbi:hypothetical protein PORY_001334 [Pneumocystis oryctolagi]|uniref:Uncharacterized protein n=1 Tax=Pneumocystis oryctolagi TaxID=42067 RepID=A0ACB7CI22_9ASCO|nr:hypothetical protein PORY_001334 [Pneumocystis oryctolagi]